MSDTVQVCQRKVRFMAKWVAEKEAERMRSKNADHKKVRAYRCSVCGAWHVGRQTRGKK